MNKRKFIIPALLFASCIVSCKAIPEDIASFLRNITYYDAVNKVKTITYTSKMNVYDNNQFKGDVIGQRSVNSHTNTKVLQIQTSIFFIVHTM